MKLLNKKSIHRMIQAGVLSGLLFASPVLALANSVPVINADQSVNMVDTAESYSYVILPSSPPPMWPPLMPDEPAIPGLPVVPLPVVPVLPPVTPPAQPEVSEPIERFVGADIEGQAHPLTTMMGVTPGNGGFVIQASSAISVVNHFVLEENRLVIDVENAVPATEANGHGHHTTDDANQLPAGVRMAAQNGFTRVVFDMDPVPNYSLQLSADRTQLHVSFVPTVIHNVSLSSDGQYDFITLTGDGLAAFRLDFLNTNQLNLQLPMVSFADHVVVNDAGTFHFITDISLSPASDLMASIDITTTDMVSYTSFAGENSVTIRLAAPTFRNIGFDLDRSVISLQGSEWVPLRTEQLSMINHYHQLRHVFTFDADMSAHFGHGYIPFNTDYSSHVIVGNNEAGQTEIVVYGPDIAYAELIQTPTGIDIRTFSPREVYDFIVMLDPGHGGSDSGAVHFGFRESDMVLIVSNAVYAWLQQHPTIGVFTTRVDDSFVSLADRAEMANGVADLFVSLHMNGFHTGVPNGTETYWRPHDEEYRWPISREAVAYIFHNNVLQDLGRANREVRTANFAVLRLTNMPSVLIEYGFMSNEAEMQAMASPEGIQAMINATFRSIVEIYELTRQPE